MKILSTLIILLLASINLLGQETIKISGRVISKRGGYCPGTNVILHGTTVGVATDACGQFEISIPRDRQGYLILSMISNPFYFDLRQLKDGDLNKDIIIKIMSFDEERKVKKIKEYDLEHNCKDNKNGTVTFKITRNNSGSPKTFD